MNHYLSPGGRISELALKIHAPQHPDQPEVSILIDGADPFLEIAPDWRGFDPNDILGHAAPLVPEPHGRRVAVYRCSCGEAGCGCIAPIVAASPDGRYVHWLDFRNFVGWFSGPIAPPVAEDEPGDGTPWDLADVRFDRGQYLREVNRAATDFSWETPRRRTARLLRERLAPLAPVLPPDLRLGWVVPAWEGDGIALSFEHAAPEDYRQVVLRLTSRHEDPETAAADLARQLLTTPPAEWGRRFARLD